MKTVNLPNPKNENILIYIDGQLYPREEARISVFDSLVQGGDGVWEGMRVYNGKVFMMDEHLDRLFDSAKAMAFEGIPERETVVAAIKNTLEANQMTDGVHIRLTLSRGKKVTSGMSPHWNQYGCSLIIIAEWKPPVFESKGIKLISSTIRRNSPSCVDSKIHHNNLINNILAKIEANLAGVDDAVMLDLQGFVAETNATNIFFVKKGVVRTPFPTACLPGITRGLVLEICRENDIPCEEANISIAEMYAADEVFITGTMGEIVPVVEIDGRGFGYGELTKKLHHLYLQKVTNFTGKT